MGKRINPQKDLSGEFYNYKGMPVEVMSDFVYEVIIGERFDNGYALLNKKLYKTKNPLQIKKSLIISKNKEKDITLIGVPKKFIEDNQLKLYIKNEHRSKRKVH